MDKTRRQKLDLVAGRFEALRPKIEEARRKLAEPKVEAEKVEAKPPRRIAVSYHVVNSAKRAEADFSVPQFQPRVAEVEKDTIVAAKIVEFAKRKPLEPEEPTT